MIRWGKSYSTGEILVNDLWAPRQKPTGDHGTLILSYFTTTLIGPLHSSNGKQLTELQDTQSGEESLGKSKVKEIDRIRHHRGI